jgi:hypothetical protein
MPRRPRAAAIVLGAVLAASCSQPFSDEWVVEPIHVDRVEVSLIETVPKQAAARVVGVIGDSCATLHSVRQERAENVVTVTIYRQRPLLAVCAEIALPYDDVIRLDGVFPAGSYVVRVNGVERAFTVP